jgi:anti-sigma B factor antagonist
MEVKRSKCSNVTVVELFGRCEIQDFDLLSQHLNSIIDGEERRLVIDFNSLNFINSAGLRAIILAIQKMRNLGGNVIFCNLNETVEKLFEITGYTSLLESYKSREAAINSYST